VTVCLERFGSRVDVLLNVAGIGDTYGSVDTLTDEKWDRIIATNLMAPREDDARGSAGDGEIGERVVCQRGEEGRDERGGDGGGVYRQEARVGMCCEREEEPVV
jgi:NAD(P)-dependent dehydrogenase (short-subunit alcohol dehydrogenase family)